MDKDTPICYFIDSVDKYLDPNPKQIWVPFIPDLCVGRVKESYKAGFFSFKLSVHDVTQDGPIDFKSFPTWKKRIPKRSVPVKIRAYIYQCRNLPAADSSGTSDPFIRLWDVSETKKKTQIVDDNNNPLFYECVELDYDVASQDDLETYPPFILDVFDNDDGIFDRTDDFLGRALINPVEASIKMQEEFQECKQHGQRQCLLCFKLLEEVPKLPKWHPIRYEPGSP